MSYVRESPINRHSKVRVCLELLADEGVLPQPEIQKRLGMDDTNIGRFIGVMERAGYLQRAILITAKGRDVLALAEDAHGPLVYDPAKELEFSKVVTQHESEAAMEMMRQALGD